MDKGDKFIIVQNGHEYTVLETVGGGYLTCQFSPWVGKPEYEGHIEMIHESEVDGQYYKKVEPDSTQK